MYADVVQRSEAWFALRAGRPTASRFAEIITASGQRSGSWDRYARELIADERNPMRGKFAGNRHTDRGEELEPLARGEFERRMGVVVVEMGFCTRDDLIIGCSPDGLIRGVGGEFVAGVEIKCPDEHKHLQFLEEGVFPAEYKQQVHGSMAVTGLDLWYFVSYAQGWEPLIVRVERDGYTERVSRMLDDFLVYYAEKRRTLGRFVVGVG